MIQKKEDAKCICSKGRIINKLTVFWEFGSGRAQQREQHGALVVSTSALYHFGYWLRHYLHGFCMVSIYPDGFLQIL